jgi:hypothetical protein
VLTPARPSRHSPVKVGFAGGRHFLSFRWALTPSIRPECLLTDTTDVPALLTDPPIRSGQFRSIASLLTDSFSNTVDSIGS